MPSRISAGILLYRIRGGAPEVLLVHPGGPFWAKKDTGAWSIPKGEIEPGADALESAKREFLEETGSSIDGAFIALTPLRQRGGKLVQAWAVQGELDADAIHSNTFSMEWPPRSGKEQLFPEIDRAQWFPLSHARAKLLEAQRGFLDELEQKLRLTRAI